VGGVAAKIGAGLLSEGAQGKMRAEGVEVAEVVEMLPGVRAVSRTSFPITCCFYSFNSFSQSVASFLLLLFKP